MALNPKMANLLKLDSDGYAYGELTSVTLIDADDNDFGKEQFQFDFTASATMKPIILKIWTGLTLSGLKHGDGKDRQYNKLTKLLLQLGSINESELITAYAEGKELPLNLDTLIGTKVKFRPLKTAKSKGLSQIDLSTLEVLK
jgi:hypothetical protein